jgi:hypothetical protein
MFLNKPENMKKLLQLRIASEERHLTNKLSCSRKDSIRIIMECNDLFTFADAKCLIC